jgi:hypothetical protein
MSAAGSVEYGQLRLLSGELCFTKLQAASLTVAWRRQQQNPKTLSSLNTGTLTIIIASFHSLREIFRVRDTVAGH